MEYLLYLVYNKVENINDLGVVMEMEIVKFLHDAGIVLGVGGVTFHFMLATMADKDESLASAVKKILPKFGKFIMLGLVLLIVSGIWLNQIVSWPIDPNVLWAKIIVIGLLVLNAIYINAFLLPKLHKMKSGDSAEASLRKQAKITRTLGLVFWWAVVVMSVFL